MLAGKPLIIWSIEAALASKTISRVLVSTDDEQIAEISRDAGAEVPFIRPAELAQDDTPDLPVCKHALQWLKDNEEYTPDTVVWLRPTCPLRTADAIDEATALFLTTKADCLRSVAAVHKHPYWMKRFDGPFLNPFIPGKDEHTYYQRQLLPETFYLNGAIDIVKTSDIMTRDVFFYGTMAGYTMPAEMSVDIDTEIDLRIAETILTDRLHV